jgi:hypothetical protein
MTNEPINVSPEASGSLDAFGMAASLLCALHCSAMPAVMALLPLAGLEFRGVEGTEYALVGLSAGLGIVSLTIGYRRHRSRRALGTLSGGLTLLTLGQVTEACGVETIGVVSAVAGGCVVAMAHFINRRLCQACSRCRQRPEATASLDRVDACVGGHRP